MSPASFLFTCCQVGAEAALKKEIAREHPELRFAYSRPGFVTFKRHDGATLAPGFVLRSVFARAYGLSRGKTQGDPAPILELARELSGGATRALRLHVWERDQHFPGDEPPGFNGGAWAQAARQALSEAATSAGERSLLDWSDALPLNGELVLDVVAVERDEWWFGCHSHSDAHAPWPGGRPTVALPSEAPSRAYIKLEEAIRWAHAPLRSGDVAVEIGSSPGGASYALLQRGLKVVGIDPAEMDPRVASNPCFEQIRRPVAQVLREELPASVQWLLLDMNVEPRISLFSVDRLATRLADTLLGVFLTVKLNQWRIADEIPLMLDHVRAMGVPNARATQLPSNRQEILIFGLTQKGLLRRPRAASQA